MVRTCSRDWEGAWQPRQALMTVWLGVATILNESFQGLPSHPTGFPALDLAAIVGCCDWQTQTPVAGGPLTLKTIIRINRVKLLLLTDSLHFIFIDQHFVEFFSPADAGDFDWIIGLARTLTYRIGQSLNGACRR